VVVSESKAATLDMGGESQRAEPCRIEIVGLGAVSPAGWGVKPIREAIHQGKALPTADVSRPGWKRPMRVRNVPSPAARNLNHPRLRRASPITRFAVGAALEALGAAETAADGQRDKLGVVLCVMTGCVNYSRRFYDEVLREPSTASPLVFPETVFNAPSSHLAAVLGAGGMNYTLVGDPSAFLVGLAVAADWLVTKRVDSCLVIGAEEIDWIVADSFRLFRRNIVLAEGAGAVYLRRASATNGATSHKAGATGQPPSGVELHSITQPHLFLSTQSRHRAARKMRAQLPEGAARHLLCDGIQDLRTFDAAEEAVWCTWQGTRISLKRLLGEGLTAAAAWQCVVAVDALQRAQFTGASVSVVGCNEQAVGAHFVRQNHAGGVPLHPGD
jgi:3-oxoacyl-(acyl-carrier-protein) synthase